MTLLSSVILFSTVSNAYGCILQEARCVGDWARIGDMSFVGPRPALFNQYDLIELRTQKGVQVLRLGLNGWSQVNGRDELPITQKLALDVEYLQRQSLWFDIKIVGLTFLKVVQRTGGAH